ncbi:transketolase family protein [Clostridium merdae]|uniref:transketolase family protein n=1 Tax=Clostridium merdae TaxID=1958780 RepID=UPI000A268155|nr:transketolase C-terminal domain-containing protein [Clostridium merdae]
MGIATRFAFGKELTELAATKDFVVCNADTKACALENFGKLYPEREFSIGIAEQNLMGTAAGFASCGNKVFASTFAVFTSMRACEQVRQFICYPKLNVTVVGTHVGLQVGGDGATHAAIEDVAIFRAMPNMTIVQPSDEVSARAVAKAAVDFEGPLYIRLHRNPADDIHDPASYEFKLGKADTIVDNGNDAVVFASGILLSKAMEAAKRLRAEGIGVKVIEIHTIKPLDEEAIIKAAKETGAVVTVEDHNIIGGLGSAVAEVLSEKIPTPMKRIGVQDRFASSGDAELLYAEHKMSVPDIVFAVKDVMSKKNSR